MRSYGLRDIAGASSARCCEVSERMCSEGVRVLSNIIWLGLMSQGLLVVTTVPICGVASRCGALGGRSGLLENGRHAVGAPKRPMLRAYSACRPQELSPA